MQQFRQQTSVGNNKVDERRLAICIDQTWEIRQKLWDEKFETKNCENCQRS